mgnify:CR=1 FL=1
MSSSVGLRLPEQRRAASRRRAAVGGWKPRAARSAHRSRASCSRRGGVQPLRRPRRPATARRFGTPVAPAAASLLRQTRLQQPLDARARRPYGRGSSRSTCVITCAVHDRHVGVVDRAVRDRATPDVGSRRRWHQSGARALSRSTAPMQRSSAARSDRTASIDDRCARQSAPVRSTAAASGGGSSGSLIGRRIDERGELRMSNRLAPSRRAKVGDRFVRAPRQHLPHVRLVGSRSDCCGPLDEGSPHALDDGEAASLDRSSTATSLRASRQLARQRRVVEVAACPSGTAKLEPPSRTAFVRSQSTLVLAASRRDAAEDWAWSRSASRTHDAIADTRAVRRN